MSQSHWACVRISCENYSGMRAEILHSHRMQPVSMRKTIIPKSWNVSPTIRQRVGEDAGRQRLIAEDDEILVLLHNVPTAQDKCRREAALFWFDGQGNWKSSPL